MLNRLKEIFKSFQEHEVKYLVIGGIASILYGVPRATLDLEDVRILQLSDEEQSNVTENEGEGT